MDMLTTGPRPVQATDRIETLDLLRGVAICGILLMNIPYMGMVGDLGMPAFPAMWNADWIAWGIQSVLFEGTMRGLFTMLFGAGMLLMLRRAEGEAPDVSPVDVWARRCWALILLGIIQFVLFLWPGEILVNYGVTGLFLLAVRTVKPRALIAGAAAILIVMSCFYIHQRVERTQMLQASTAAAAAKAANKKLTEEQEGALEAREKAIEIYHPKPADTARQIKERTHFPSILTWSLGQWNDWNMGGSEWYLLICESIAFMMIGMALFRTGILTGNGSAATYRWMMLIGYGGGFAGRLVALYWGSRTGFDLDFDKLSVSYTVFRNAMYEPTRLAITIGHVGLLATLFRSGALGRAKPLRALGRMALTVYSLQSIITSVLFYALGWVGSFGFATLMAIAVSIWVITGAFAMWWLDRFDMGPAERFLRAMSYGSLSMLRPKPVTASIAPIS